MRWNFNTNEAYQILNENEVNAGFKVKRQEGILIELIAKKKNK